MWPLPCLGEPPAQFGEAGVTQHPGRVAGEGLSEGCRLQTTALGATGSEREWVLGVAGCFSSVLSTSWKLNAVKQLKAVMANRVL